MTRLLRRPSLLGSEPVLVIGMLSGFALHLPACGEPRSDIPKPQTGGCVGSAAGGDVGVPNYWSGTMMRSQDDVAIALELTDEQRESLQKIVRDAERELDRLRDIPDGDGDTIRTKFDRFRGQALSQELAQAEFDARQFMARTIPGTQETFADRENSIRSRGRRRVREMLSAAQRRYFLGIGIYAIFGPSAGPWALGMEDEGRIATEERASGG